MSLTLMSLIKPAAVMQEMPPLVQITTLGGRQLDIPATAGMTWGDLINQIPNGCLVCGETMYSPESGHLLDGFVPLGQPITWVMDNAMTETDINPITRTPYSKLNCYPHFRIKTVREWNILDKQLISQFLSALKKSGFNFICAPSREVYLAERHPATYDYWNDTEDDELYSASTEKLGPEYCDACSEKGAATDCQNCRKKYTELIKLDDETYGLVDFFGGEPTIWAKCAIEGWYCMPFIDERYLLLH